MPRTRPAYPPEFKTQIIELARSGRSLPELAREFEPTLQTIQNWVKQADLDDGLRQDGSTSCELDELRELRQENKRLKQERDILAKAGGLVCAGDRKHSTYQMISVYQADYPISMMCRVLEVSTSGYYAWQNRAPSARSIKDRVLSEMIKTYHKASYETYGAPRIHADLRDAGIRISRKRVARLMREAGLRGVSRRKFVKTTKRDRTRRAAKDLVERNFVATRPDELWVADITFVPTATGFLFLAVVLDVFSRKIVGWAMAAHLRTSLVLAALDMAIATRKPRGVIHHSDQGCQYTSVGFGARCREAGVRPSTGSVGDCYDNAMAESFFATLETELLDRKRFRNKSEARIALFHYIEGFYNPRRRHSSIGTIAPIIFENQYHKSTQITKPETVH
ncbi:MAG: IS3 family transposase [Bacteroidetes bacterium]|nr:IS3 family transposase [Bacteroidota bacterium]